MIAGKGEYKTLLDICASSFTKAVIANKSELLYLKDIYLVLKDSEAEILILDDFTCLCKITDRTETGNVCGSAKTLEDMLTEKDNCCMCMDTSTNPKKLKRCGYIFCKECIEQFFRYKPSCPRCGVIYGKVTGNQPPGTMSVSTNGIILQGFNDSTGTIVLTYLPDDGYQGVSILCKI